MLYARYFSFLSLSFAIYLPFIEGEKQLGKWTNGGACVAAGADPTCGPGEQKQQRTCRDGATDKCTATDIEQTISCKDAGTALPDCGK